MENNEAPGRLQWNEFQRLHKGNGWTQQQMSEQWQAYKKEYSANPTAAASNIYIWVQQQLGRRTGSKDQKPRQKQDSNKDNADLPATAWQTPCKQYPKHELMPPDCGVTTPLSVTISTLTPSSCSSASSHTPHKAAGGSASLQTNAQPQHNQLNSTVQQPSPSPSPCSSRSSPKIPSQHLEQLRAAVQHLVAGHPKQQNGSMQQEAHNKQTDSIHANQKAYDYVDDRVSHKGQQQQRQNKGSRGAAVGCFGMSAGMLSWNSFQKACKGLGLTKVEISAAYKQYKASGQMPEQLQQSINNKTAALAQQLPTQEQQLHQHHHVKLGKLDAFKDWVQSTFSSRATSRAVSRVGSRVASAGGTPHGSPGSKPKLVKQEVLLQQQHASVSIAATETQWLELDTQSQQDDGFHLMQQESQKEIRGDALQQKQTQDKQQQACCNSSITADNYTWVSAQMSDSAQESGGCAVHSTSAHIASNTSNYTARDSNSTRRISSNVSSSAVVFTAERRVARELVPHDSPGLLDQFSAWIPVSLELGELKQLKNTIPAKPGLYEWGVRVPPGMTTADLATAAAVAAGIGGSSSRSNGVTTRSGLHTGRSTGISLFAAREAHKASSFTEYGSVICFYLGKAGALSGGRQNRRPQSAATGTASSSSSSNITAAASSAPGETLRTRFNKYALTKARRLGPVGEPYKDALFEQLQAAGGQLYYRWCVATDMEPLDMEKRLLQQLDYAANVVNNGQRRVLLVP